MKPENRGGGEMKTLQNVKEDLAHEYSFKTWRDMYLYTDLPGGALIDKVATLYAIGVIRAIADKFNYRSEAWKTIMDTIKELK